MAYYCTECEKTHRNTSGIGQRHAEYKGEPPTVISVKPDRSKLYKTGLSITGMSGEMGTILNQIPGIYDYIPSAFTESLLDDLRDHIKKFPLAPYNYTPQKLEQLRKDQASWLRTLKTLLTMD